MPTDLPALGIPADSELAARVKTRMAQIRALRDEHGWPEPRTVEELREDPRVQLRNRVDLIEPSVDELVLAASLILVVATDKMLRAQKREERTR